MVINKGIEQIDFKSITLDSNLILLNSSEEKIKKNFIINTITDLAVNKDVAAAVINSKLKILDATKEIIQNQVEFNINENITNEEWKELSIKISNLMNSKIFLSSENNIDLKELLKKCNELIENKNIKVIIIDDITSIEDYEEENTLKELEELTNTYKITVLAIK